MIVSLHSSVVEQVAVVHSVACSIQVEETDALVTQLAEYAAVNRKVIGSIPIESVFF
jgi:hypothetical protein